MRVDARVQEELLEARTESANIMESLSSAKKDLLRCQDKVKEVNGKLDARNQELEGLMKSLQEAWDEITCLNDFSSKSFDAVELLESEVIDVCSFLSLTNYNVFLFFVRRSGRNACSIHPCICRER